MRRSDGRGFGGYRHRDLTGPVAFVAVAVAYLAFAQLVLWLNDPVSSGAGLWPAAGVTLSALLLLPTRRWGWVVGAVVVAELGGDLAHGYGLWASLGWTLGNVVEPLVGASLLRRVGNRDGSITPLRNLLLFMALGVGAGPLVGATIGSSATVLSMDMGFSQVWPKYFVGDALGVLIVAPAILAFRVPRVGQHRLEAAALAGLSLATCWAVFGDWSGDWLVTMPYLLMLFLTWAALRFGVRGVAWLGFAVTMIGNAATAYGDGPFARAGGPEGQAVTLLQIFLTVSLSCSLLLAALVHHLTDRERIENEWRHQATHDSLTGLANRGLLRVILDSAVTAAGRGGPPVSLAMCDLDGFKQVNDRYGHPCGDLLLQTVARRLQDAVRPGDLVARVSGDEFVIVLHDSDAEAASQVADRVLAQVSGPLRLLEGDLMVPTISVGVAAYHPGDGPHDLYDRADRAMYHAKRAGGNRVRQLGPTAHAHRDG